MARGQQKIQSQQKKRDKLEAAKGGKSSLAVNAAAKSIQCKVCMNTFLCTTKKPELETHASNKHSKKTFEQCFPNFDGAAARATAAAKVATAKDKKGGKK
eukprot:m.67286 g.67286  ORF g.67286 m.67286 type:complete len:100 (-) comp13817_c0_seq3:117-416(-)